MKIIVMPPPQVVVFIAVTGKFIGPTFKGWLLFSLNNELESVQSHTM